MIKGLFTYLLAIIITTTAVAQEFNPVVFHKNDRIIIELLPNSGYFYTHKVVRGNTIYSLARTFNTTVGELCTLNKISASTPLEIDQTIKIPVNPTILYQGESINGFNGSYIPVYYQVRPKETLFRIAKMYFNQEIDDIKSKNNLHSTNLNIGQKLLIGWLPVEGTILPKKIIRQKVEEIAAERVISYDDHITVAERDETFTPADTRIEKPTQSTVDSLNVTTKQEKKINKYLLGDKTDETLELHKENTVAHWDKSIPDNGVAYALHNKARPNTYIEIYNPNLKRSIRAKVIGKIPFGTYTNDVKLVISPRAANLLGGLDQRFRVEIKYMK